MHRIQFVHKYNHIISLENLLEAWGEFICGKRKREDVQIFERNLMNNLIALHNDLREGKYRHSLYKAFNISDPKPRRIHKASVRDRVLHHAIYRKIYPFFERTFIADSYSCRINKGTHKAGIKFQNYARRVSSNNTRTCWVLKCDIRKFFASIDHGILLEILAGYIPDLEILLLLEEIVDSFNGDIGVGLPLGNFMSQIFCNIYMNEFDHFVKHKLKAKYYIRYADDFVLLSEDKDWLEAQIPWISDYLNAGLKLSLHPNKVSIESFSSGVDFLGWIYFPTHKVIRTVTKRRMFKKVLASNVEETLQSYLGMLSHGNSFGLQEELLSLNKRDTKVGG